jgi:hypothetical protein
MKANITLKLDAEILREARILAPNRAFRSALCLLQSLMKSSASARDTIALENAP